VRSVAVCHAESSWRVTAAEAEALIRAHEAGDSRALEEILTPYEAPLFRVCIGILGNREDAEDAVQETLLRALRSLPRFRGESGVRTWLQRIAINVCLEWKRRRRNAAALDEAAGARDPQPGPDAIAIQQAMVFEALASLTPRQRAAVVLHVVEGLTMQEIAATLGWTPKKVENELYRARQALARWRASHE